MAFADLSFDEQVDLIAEALQDLLGEKPTKVDYIALVVAAEATIEAMRAAVMKDIGMTPSA